MKKLKNILIFIIIFILMAAIILPKEISDLDEIWNYNFAKNIAEGRVPYRDFNMLQTPALSFFVAIFFKIFSNELIITRILSIFLNTTILFLCSKILARLRINSYINGFMLLGLFWLLKPHFCLDYNFANLLILLIIIYIELGELERKEFLLKENKKKDFYLIGLLSRSCLMYKTDDRFIYNAYGVIL